MDLATRDSLREISFIEILKDAARSDLTGMIRLENGPIVKVIYFQNGTLAFASSNEKNDRLTEVLKRAGKLTPEQVEDAQTRLKPHTSLGKTLVELGYISARDLLWGARAQVEGILYQLLFWKEGNYQVLEGSLPKEIIVLNLSVPGVIFEGILRTQDRQWILQHIGSPEAVYMLSPDFHEKYIPYKLRMLKADAIISLIDGKRTLEQVAQAAGIDTFEVCKTAVALQCLSLISKVPAPVQMALHDLEAEIEPSLEEEIDIVEPPPAEIKWEEPDIPRGTADENVSRAEVLRLPSTSELQQETTPEPETEAAAPEEDPMILEISSPILPEEPPATTVLEEEMTQEEERRAASSPNWGRIVLTTALILLVASVGYYYLQWRAAQTSPAASSITEPVNHPPPSKPPATRNTALTPVAGSAPSGQQTSASPDEAASDSRPADMKVASPPVTLLQKDNLPEAAQQWKAQLMTDKSQFTVQLLIACQKKTVTDAFSSFEDNSKLYVIPLQYKGQACYRVLYGTFPNAEAAERARSELPAVFLQQVSAPQVVSLPTILK